MKNPDTLEYNLKNAMRIAQEFASSWSLVGGRFDTGSGLEDATESKLELEALLRRLIGASTPTWVSADERLPEVRANGYSGLVLVTDGVAIATRFYDPSEAGSSLRGWRSPRPMGGGVITGAITHWTPSPVFPAGPVITTNITQE